MSTDLAVELFLQRILHEKCMEDTVVDSLIQGIIRGTGVSFTSKSSFIEHTNNLLMSIGFMLVRTNVAGRRYYSLRDLDSDNYKEQLSNDAQAVPEIDQSVMKTPTRKVRNDDYIDRITSVTHSDFSASRNTPTFKIQRSKFTQSELLVFIDCINSIIETGKPLPFNNIGTLSSWNQLCIKRSILEPSSQMNLLRRFEGESWLSLESESEIVPGVRFYFEHYDVFDFKNVKICQSCRTPILYNEEICQKCHGSFHSSCLSSNVDKMEIGETCRSCSDN